MLLRLDGLCLLAAGGGLASLLLLLLLVVLKALLPLAVANVTRLPLYLHNLLVATLDAMNGRRPRMRASFPGQSRGAACGCECTGTDSRLIQLECFTKDFDFINKSNALLAGFESECYALLCFGGLCGNVTCRVGQLVC
jgi:hypothetical protein